MYVMVHTKYVPVLKSSNECYSASDSTKSCCSTYTPYTIDIFKQIIMPYDVPEIQGVSVLRKIMKIRLVHDLYMHMIYTVFVCTSPE